MSADALISSVGKRRVMLLGTTGCGKSALAEMLEGRAISRPHTQEVVYGSKVMDVPCGYMEHADMFQSVIALAQNNASHVVVVVMHTTQGAQSIPPGFCHVFTCGVTGVVLTEGKQSTQMRSASKELARIGVPEPFVIVNSTNGDGLEELFARVAQ